MDSFKLEKQEESAKRPGLNLLSVIESRILEIKQLEKECRQKVPKLYLQRLPRFMRRRAASHNINRLPKKAQVGAKSLNFGTKDRRTLNKFRRSKRFKKHKRCLHKHQSKRIHKGLLHKWFAKRFHICPKTKIPLYNATKNQRNLYRHSRYNCAFISLDCLCELQIKIKTKQDELLHHLSILNGLTDKKTGFTFLSKSFINQKYEVQIYLYERHLYPNNYICTCRAFISQENEDVKLKLWVPRVKAKHVEQQLVSLLNDKNLYEINAVNISKQSRVRCIGPKVTRALTSLCDSDAKVEELHGCLAKVPTGFKATMGLKLHPTSAVTMICYNTSPPMIDAIFDGKQGRLAWYKLIRNKTHVVGGYRDVKNLLLTNYTKFNFEFGLNGSDLVRDESFLASLRRVRSREQFSKVLKTFDVCNDRKKCIKVAFDTNRSVKTDLDFCSYNMSRGGSTGFKTIRLEDIDGDEISKYEIL